SSSAFFWFDADAQEAAALLSAATDLDLLTWARHLGPVTARAWPIESTVVGELTVVLKTGATPVPIGRIPRVSLGAVPSEPTRVDQLTHFRLTELLREGALHVRHRATIDAARFDELLPDNTGLLQTILSELPTPVAPGPKAWL